MQTKSISRRHHYLPQAYLAQFTETQSKDGFLYAFDMGTGRSFRTTPLNVATQRDFNRVDIEGHPPDAIENALSSFEGQAALAIRRVIDTQRFPNNKDYNLILNLLGLIAVRNPKLRNAFNNAREASLRKISERLVSKKERWERQVKSANEAGYETPEQVSYEDAKRFVESGKYSFEFHPEGNLRIEFKTFDEILPLLVKRTWTVLVAPDDGPEFICSDHPVTISWKGERSGPIGLGLENTEVYFPLGRRVGFLGVFEDHPRPVERCKPGYVARMNARVARNALRQIYFTRNRISIWINDEILEIQCEA